MSAYDFKAQASPQSIGATSIPSAEIFGTATLADNRRVTISSGIVSRAGFTTNSSLSYVNGIFVNSGIASSEVFLNNNTFGLNTNFLIPAISPLLRDSGLTSPILTSSIGITLNPIQTEEAFISPNIAGVNYISFSGNGIPSLEVLGTHTINTNTFIVIDSPINSLEAFNLSNVLYASNNIYPTAIGSSELFENTNIFGNITGIFLTSGIRTAFSSPSNSQFDLLGIRLHITLNSGILSKEEFGRRTIFFPPPPSFLEKGFIYGFTTVVNNVLVTIERENILDTITKIPEKIFSNQSKSETLNSYIENKHTILSSIDVVYNIEGEIIEERNLTARQTDCYLESYIKQKYKISSSIYVDQNDNFYTNRSGKIN